MKKILAYLTIFLIGITFLNAQTIKVAILDFENTSGIEKYDGLGKAMSSMLITDIEANVSPKRLQLVERAQIQKILKEQNFQASSAVDKTTTVQAGKLLGVKYLLVGDIYILNDVLVINARLTDTETGDIKFSKKQEGKLVGWLNLKTNIAKELAKSIAMPFTDPNIPDKEINMATITSFGNAITAKDEGKIEKAEELANTIQEFSPDFKYLDDLKSQLDDLKKQILRLEKDVEITTTDPLNAALNYDKDGHFDDAEKYLIIGRKRLDKNNLGGYIVYNFYLADLCLRYKQFDKAIQYSNDVLVIYPLFEEFLRFKLLALESIDKSNEIQDALQFYFLNSINTKSLDYFDQTISDYCKKNDINIRSNGIVTVNNYAKNNGFVMQLDSKLELKQGLNDYNKDFLGFYCGVLEKKNGRKAVIDFLENLNLGKIENAIVDSEIKVPYYLPKSQYISKNTFNEKAPLIILISKQKYEGSYHEKSNGTIWTKNGPNECPCLKLVTENEIKKMSSSNKVYDELSLNKALTLGWYYILYKKFDKSIQQYESAILYDNKNLLFYNSSYLRNIADSMMKYYKKYYTDNNGSSAAEFDNIYEIINISIALKIIYDEPNLLMQYINLAHALTLSGKTEKALMIYSSLNRNYTFDESFNNLTVKLVIEKDYKDFINNGLISDSKANEVLKKIFGN